MRAEVKAFYGLTRAVRGAGYYETNHHQQLIRDIKNAVDEGGLVALTGVVGAGKTAMLRRLQDVLTKEGRVIVARSVAIEKAQVSLSTLLTALYCDLSTDKDPKLPNSRELRDRAVVAVAAKRKKPVVLIVEEAHELHHLTLTGLKRLAEAFEFGGSRLCVLLVGWPKLRNDLRNPSLEEVGSRTTVFTLEGVTGAQREYIRWLIGVCAAEGVLVDDVIDPAALDLLASRLRTPLQIEDHLTLALETGYQTSDKPISEAIVDSVLSKQINDMEPTLSRHGYTPKILAELLGAKPAEIKALFRQALTPERAKEIKEQMLAAGLPV